MANLFGTSLLPVGWGDPSSVANINSWYYDGDAANGDKIYFGQLNNEQVPAFTTLFTSEVVTGSYNSEFSFDLGYEAVDGDVVTTNATDLTYFNDAESALNAGIYPRTEPNQPVTTPKASWIVLTVHGGFDTGTITVNVTSRQQGTP